MIHTPSDTITHQELEVLVKLREWNLISDLNAFLTRPDAHSRLVTGVMGWQWEDTFRDVCALRGLECTQVGLNTKHDWLINGHRVQCKFSNASPRVDIRNKDKECKRRYKTTDFEFMALRVHPINSTFIIPVGRLLDGDTGLLRGSIDVNEISDCLDRYEDLHACQGLPELPATFWTEDIEVQVWPPVFLGEDGEEKAGETREASQTSIG